MIRLQLQQSIGLLGCQIRQIELHHARYVGIQQHYAVPIDSQTICKRFYDCGGLIAALDVRDNLVHRRRNRGGLLRRGWLCRRAPVRCGLIDYAQQQSAAEECNVQASHATPPKVSTLRTPTAFSTIGILDTRMRKRVGKARGFSCKSLNLRLSPTSSAGPEFYFARLNRASAWFQFTTLQNALM